MRYLLLALILSGCEIKVENTSAAEAHTCSVEQLANVDKYLSVCLKSGYFSSYCFDRGVESFCTKKGATK